MAQPGIGLWVACFVATMGTLSAKFYFTKAIERLRQRLAHLQREALEQKGELADTRQTHAHAIRESKEKTATIKQLKSQTLEVQAEVKQLEEDLKKARNRPKRH